MVADLVLEFLVVSRRTVDRCATTGSTLALHRLRDGGRRDVPPLLLLHGLGERTPDTAPPPWTDGWPGPVWGLDFTGHGASTLPDGGGYTAEILMADADAAARPPGRGDGGRPGPRRLRRPARRRRPPRRTCGAPCSLDGPGLAGGGPGPGLAHDARRRRLPGRARPTRSPSSS